MELELLRERVLNRMATRRRMDGVGWRCMSTESKLAVIINELRLEKIMGIE